MPSNNNKESQRLILSFSELNTEPLPEDDEEIDVEYASASQAFFDQSLHGFVCDEVHAMMQILFCEATSCWASFCNPFYLALFILIFIVTYPGVCMHWIFLDCIPVRKCEVPEERELRSQGIYTALGIAIISIPFAIAGLFLGTDIMILINEVSIGVNTAIIITNLLALKAIAEELSLSVKTYIIGVWIVDIFLIGLCLVDVYNFVTLSWLSAVEYFLRVMEIIIYTIIIVHCMQFWSLYDNSRKAIAGVDYCYAGIMIILFALVILGFCLAILISEEDAWKIMYW